MSEEKRCTMLFGYCKRGHPKTAETTFDRKVCIHKNGREYRYIVRECRICHSFRNVRNAGCDKTGRKNNSKWLRFMESADA